MGLPYNERTQLLPDGAEVGVRAAGLHNYIPPFRVLGEVREEPIEAVGYTAPHLIFVRDVDDVVQRELDDLLHGLFLLRYVLNQGEHA